MFLCFFGAAVLISFSSLFFGTSVLILFFWEVFSEPLFSCRFRLVYFGASVLLSSSQYRFLLIFFAEHMFPCCKFVSSSLFFIGARVLILGTFLVVFVRTRVPRLQVCIGFAGFVQARAPILEAWSTCFLTGPLYRLRWGVFRSTCSQIALFSGHVFPGYKFVSFSAG